MISAQYAKIREDLLASDDPVQKILIPIMLHTPLPRYTQCVPLQDGFLTMEWIYPHNIEFERVILYFHGGGYNKCSINTHRGMVANLAAMSSATGLIVEYRLAPKYPFPAAIEDCLQAYRFLLNENFDPQKVVLVGDSAGGGLVLTTMMQSRDLNLPLPAAGVCISPWVDLSNSFPSFEENASLDPWLKTDELNQMARNYLQGNNMRNPIASPLYGSLKGLPPLLIQAGTHEILIDDALSLAKKAQKDGVKVFLETWPQMIHVWHLFAPEVPESCHAMEKIALFIREFTK